LCVHTEIGSHYAWQREGKVCCVVESCSLIGLAVSGVTATSKECCANVFTTLVGLHPLRCEERRRRGGKREALATCALTERTT
jgi:hypothetical protein